MTVDPLRLAVALVPIAAYALLIALLNLRRQPFLTSGGCDLAALGAALSGLVFVGPLELFRPEAATQSFGNYIWLFLISFYWLSLVLVVLLSRPRLVVYNISIEELHSILAGVTGRMDESARWAGNNLSLPALGVHLHLDSLDVMRNVSLVASGGRQNLDGWRRLARELGRSLKSVRVKPNPRSVSLCLLSALLLAICMTHLLLHQTELQQAMNDVFAY
jgi:hypothetical protein